MMVDHLLSQSWDAEMPFPEDNDRVAVVSLHSWTYTSLQSKKQANTFNMLPNRDHHPTVVRTKCVDLLKKRPKINLAALTSACRGDGYTITSHCTTCSYR
jgi:hypothetical protein